jgi:hypothetical protein
MASLLYPDDDAGQSQWPTSLLPVDDQTPPTDPQADALGQLYQAISGHIARQGGEAFRYANNPIGTETTRPEQSVSMPRDFTPAALVGGGAWGPERPIAQADVDAFGRGSLDLFNQASLLGGSRGVFAPEGGGGGAVTLASRRPLSNPPPAPRGLLDPPAPPPEPPPPPPPGFTAYHGSPHSFDQFDLSKIGTGEGAQTYGHGMYLADAEALAQFYRKKLAGPAPGYTGEIAPELRSALRDEDYLGFDTPGEALQAIRAHPDWATLWDVQDPNTLTPLLEAHDAAKYGGQGRMYEVKVNADPAHFLDWDKPLSAQHPNVQDALRPLISRDQYRNLTEGAWKNTPVGTGLPSLTTPQTAAALQQAGIPGIRYLDAGSRGAGEGSRNTVVFSPEIMEIIRKYGIAGLMAGGAGAAGVGQQGQQQ